MSNKCYIDLSVVKRIAITEILTGLGVEPVMRRANDWAYHAPWREDRNASLHVRPSTNTWKDFGETGSGTSNIDLIIRLGIAHNCYEAALWILNRDRSYSSVSLNSPQKSSSVVAKSSVESKIVEDIEIESESLYSYGESRGITREVLTRYCRQVSFRSQSGYVYTAIGFRNVDGGYVLRYGRLKCNLGPSTFSVVGESSNSEVCVFEGFMDFLSYRELYPGKAYNYLILNSVSHSEKVAHYLRDMKFSQVMCYLDSDEKGCEALSTICKIVGLEKTSDESNIYASLGLKDLNEYLISLK